MLDLDESTVGWLRRLEAGAMACYSDDEIWNAWNAAGLPLMADTSRLLGIIDQAELLKRVAAAIHTHVYTSRHGHVTIRTMVPSEYPVVEEKTPGDHDWSLRVGKAQAVFCAACGLDQAENEYDDGCVGDMGPDARRANIEATIAMLMSQRTVERRAAWHMRAIEAAEKGHPACPQGYVRVPVGRFDRRYQDVVGGWNKRAVR